ncbi:MAG: ShlB/FhaC/HecB family hemolysin secretion/activation protein [Burkholderiaceae bacterium]|nr:ShlB/FhaC/HecB family hemolysin secretion/activation protein [Burkholderiaceae bacterium]
MLSLILGSDVAAQNVPSPADLAREALRRQEERTKEQQERLQPKADVLQSVEARTNSTDLPIESPCFIINHISIGGVDGAAAVNRHFGSFASVTDPFLHRCVGAAGLSKIASVLDAKLIDRGYVTTRVSLSKQNLSDGNLNFFLHEGRIADVIMVKLGQAGTEASSDLTDDAWGTWKNAFPLSKGEILNIRDIEQGVEQMKRLPSQTVDTKIEPGQDPDTSIVRIERQVGGLRERLRGGVSLDNSGSQSLGRALLSANLALDNPAGLNDILSLSGNINAQRPTSTHRSYGTSLGYNIPWGYHSLNIGVSSSNFAQFVEGTTARFLSHGSSNNFDVRWNYLAWRSASTKVGVYAGISTRNAESFLDDVELILQRRRTSTLAAGITYKRYIGQGSVDFDLGYRIGVPWLGAQEDFSGVDAGGLTLRPRIVSFSGGLHQPFVLDGRNIQWSTNVRGQYTKDATLSIDQISIGSVGSVRGFDGDNVLLAESGLIVRNELSTPLALFAGVNSTVFAGFDFGKVSGPSRATLVGSSLAGLVFGVRGEWHRVLFDISVGSPVYKPARFRSQRLNPYLSITYAF